MCFTQSHPIRPPQYDPSLSQAWITWTTFESMIQDFERVRAIFELAVKQALDMPELVWKAYIDFEAEQGERERTRHLYERLLEKTGHVKVSQASTCFDAIKTDTVRYRSQVYISYALMEASKLGGDDDEEEEVPEEQDNGNPELARAVFERGYKDLKDRGEKEDVSGDCFHAVEVKS